LRAGDCLVFNDTRVIPAQLTGRRGEATIGATLHKREGPRIWRAFIRNAKRLHEDDAIDFGAGVSAVARDRGDDGSWLLDFAGDEPVEILLERAGSMPLPPYIAGKRRPTRATPMTIRRCSRPHPARSLRRPPRSIHASAGRGAYRGGDRA